MQISKADGEFLLTQLMRFHVNKQKYLYTNIHLDRSILILSNCDEHDMKLGSPDVNITVIKLLSDRLKNLIFHIFETFKVYNDDKVFMVVDLSKMFFLLKQAKWDISGVSTIYKDGWITIPDTDTTVKKNVIAEPLTSQLTYVQTVDRLQDLLVDDPDCVYFPLTNPPISTEAMRVFTVSSDMVKDASCFIPDNHKLSFILLRGVEWLTPKLVEGNENKYGVKLWLPNGANNVYRVCGYYENEHISAISTRLYAYTTPTKVKTK